MPNGEDVVKWFLKTIQNGDPSRAIRFYYISAVHNQVLRFGKPRDKAVSTLFSVSFNYSASVSHLESNKAGPHQICSVALKSLCLKYF